MISIPEAPLRCPPGPYERACQVAAYFKRAKPRSKVLIVDANEDVLSKGALFKRAWTELYPGLIEYQPNSKAVDVDVATRTVKLEFGDVKGDVLNVLPPMKAGNIAAPFITANGRWCEVDWLTYESKAAPGVHVLGDSLQTRRSCRSRRRWRTGTARFAPRRSLISSTAARPSLRPPS